MHFSRTSTRFVLFYPDFMTFSRFRPLTVLAFGGFLISTHANLWQSIQFSETTVLLVPNYIIPKKILPVILHNAVKYVNYSLIESNSPFKTKF